MKPTKGRIVYFNVLDTNNVTDILAAFITNTHENNVVNLAVLADNGVIFVPNVSQGSDPGQWDWMPYQKEQAAKESAAPEKNQ